MYVVLTDSNLTKYCSVNDEWWYEIPETTYDKLFMDKNHIIFRSNI